MPLLTKAQAELLASRKEKQQLFDVVVTKMRKQGGPGLENKLRCSDGTKCAVGHLIPDRFYVAGFEGRPINEVMIDVLEFPRLGYQFYDDIQAAHDASASAKHWWAAFTNQMGSVARKHCLDPSSLKHGKA